MQDEVMCNVKIAIIERRIHRKAHERVTRERQLLEDMIIYDVSDCWESDLLRAPRM